MKKDKTQLKQLAQSAVSYETFLTELQMQGLKTVSKRTYFNYRNDSLVDTTPVVAAIKKLGKAGTKAAKPLKALKEQFATIPSSNSIEATIETKAVDIEKDNDYWEQRKSLIGEVNFLQVENDQLKKIIESSQSDSVIFEASIKSLETKIEFLTEENAILVERQNDKETYWLYGIVALILILTFKNVYSAFSSFDAGFSSFLFATIFAVSGIAISQKRNAKNIALIISAVCVTWECVFSSSAIMQKMQTVDDKGIVQYASIILQMHSATGMESDTCTILVSFAISLSISAILYSCLFLLIKK